MQNAVDSLWYRNNFVWERVIALFWTVRGEEGYILKVKNQDDTTMYQVMVLGYNYTRWALPGHFDVDTVKAHVAQYFERAHSWKEQAKS